MSVAKAKIAIIGTGPSGLIAALALSRSGFEVLLIGPPPNQDDRRTTALMLPSLAFLDSLGLGDRIEEAGAPLRIMRIVDGTNRLVRAPTVTFRASEIGEDGFGLNIPNRRLVGILADAVAERSGSITHLESLVTRFDPRHGFVELHCDDGSRHRVALCVGADGRSSPARAAAGIEPNRTPLPQSALVTTFRHSRPHEHISTEFHLDHGPFTQVPLPDENESSLVWVDTPPATTRRLALGDEELAERIEAQMHSILGKVTLSGPRGAYRLSAARPTRYAGRRIALVGEAAHTFPPIGAQGLNLAVRDVADLERACRHDPTDPGTASVLARYDSIRRPDVFIRSSAVLTLNRSLLTDMVPLRLLRAAGLEALRTTTPLRGFAMREGMRPGSGFRAFAHELRQSLRDQIRR